MMLNTEAAVRMFFKMGVLKNFANFTEMTCVEVSF